MLRFGTRAIALGLVSLASACLPKESSDDGGSKTSSAIGTPDYEDVESYIKSKNLSIEANKALIDAINATAVISDGCTGWLLTPKHVVTNHHCVVDDFKITREGRTYDDYDQGNCTSMRIRFDKQANLSAPGYTRPPSTVFGCAKIVVANQAHDLAIIELNQQVPSQLVPLRIAKDFNPGGQEIILIGQPNGDDKKISYQNKVNNTTQPCTAKQANYPNGGDGADDPHAYERAKNPNSFVHDCDTIGGNSGSPVFDSKTMEVVGLHWNGWKLCKWPYYSASGKIDNANVTYGHGNTAEGRAANEASDRIPYVEGNAAIDIMKIREFLLAMPAGTEAGQLPEEIRAAFQ